MELNTSWLLTASGFSEDDFAALYQIIRIQTTSQLESVNHPFRCPAQQILCNERNQRNRMRLKACCLELYKLEEALETHGLSKRIALSPTQQTLAKHLLHAGPEGTLGRKREVSNVSAWRGSSFRKGDTLRAEQSMDCNSTHRPSDRRPGEPWVLTESSGKEITQ